jgi:hypothetical protein
LSAVADGRTASLDPVLAFGAQTFAAGRIERMRDFFVNPASLTAYLAQHCSTQQLNVTASIFTSFPPQYTDAEAVSTQLACVNITYLQVAYTCGRDSAQHQSCRDTCSATVVSTLDTLGVGKCPQPLHSITLHAQPDVHACRQKLAALEDLRSDEQCSSPFGVSASESCYDPMAQLAPTTQGCARQSAASFPTKQQPWLDAAEAIQAIHAQCTQLTTQVGAFAVG